LSHVRRDCRSTQDVQSIGVLLQQLEISQPNLDKLGVATPPFGTTNGGKAGLLESAFRVATQFDQPQPNLDEVRLDLWHGA
jgi:hypothetical protein